MSIYTPLPESLILTTKQVKDFEKLQHSLIHMRTWLESHDYQGTAVERVRLCVRKTSWLGRRKLVTRWEDQRIYRLSVPYEHEGWRGVQRATDAFAVNIDGVLLGNYPYTHHGLAGIVHYSSEWVSAQDAGLKPASIPYIIEAIDRATAQ